MLELELSDVAVSEVRKSLEKLTIWYVELEGKGVAYFAIDGDVEPQLESFADVAVVTGGNVSRATRSTELATLPFVTVPQLDRPGGHGDKPCNRIRAPDSAQEILVLLHALSESVLFMDAVVSRIRATL